MKELTIEIAIDEFGELEAETFGFRGKICESELNDLLQDDFILGDVDKKDDYYKPVEEEVAGSTKIIGRKK